MSDTVMAQHFEPKYMFMNGFDFALQREDQLIYKLSFLKLIKKEYIEEMNKTINSSKGIESRKSSKE